MKRRCLRSVILPRAPLPRDLEVLRSIVWARYLTTTQITALHFPSKRVAQRRLRSLLDLGLARGVLQGEALHVDSLFVPTPAGVRALASDGADASSIRPVRVPRLRVLPHGLAIRDVFVAFRVAEAQGVIHLEDFLFEGDLARVPALVAAGLVPDAIAMLRAGPGERRVAIEVDLGTEPLGVLRDKFRRYVPLVANETVHEVLVVLARGARRALPDVLAKTGLAAHVSTGGDVATFLASRYTGGLNADQTTAVFCRRVVRETAEAG